MVNSAIERLAAMPRFVSTICLRRVSAVLENEGIVCPPSIAITGSKGKGSVAAMTDALLRSIGLRTVRHTSPHFISPSERIALNGDPINDAQFEDLLQRVLDATTTVSRRYQETFARFEILFLAAVLLSQDERVDCAILEGGIGGRLDPTSVVGAKLFGLTSVELEHTDLLGRTVDQIACDKLDIGGTHSTAILGAIDPTLVDRVSYYASRRDIKMVRATDRFCLYDYAEDVNGARARVRARASSGDRSVRLPLFGQYQLNNAAVALALAEHFTEPDIGPDVDWIGVAGTAWNGLSVPGRLETIRTNPTIVVDAAHTPDSVKGVVSTLLRWRQERRVLLVGVSEDKDWQGIADILVQLAASIIVSRSGPRGLNPDQLANAFRDCGGNVVSVTEDLPKALELAIDEAKRGGATLYVIGSLYFSADVVRLLTGSSPADAIIIG
ncbi:bifunctional folylpolyglutamate synthase/dihydrofolate synthase [Bradyrhizobium oligotrophicum]|uniref:bifunctional folylpolyglutamate synthase/dihydrofolate synthase n=1 Tax=Bradyrhizobium oligotrophicum TaxID=44255 RepID=UPI003EC0616F